MNKTFLNGNIVLYGEGEWCKNFYKKFSQFYNISEIVYTENCEEAEKIFQGINIKTCQQNLYIFEHLHNSKYIVCPGPSKMEEHDEFLYSKGYVYGEDYVDSLHAEYYFRRKIKFHMKDKEVWIFGAGTNGKIFYEKYRDRYNIKGFLSNYENEKVYMNLPVLRPTELIGKRKIYIVICSAIETEMAEQLKSYGFEENRCFSVSKWIGKQLFVGWGACQVYSVYNMLLENSAFEKAYDRIFMFDSKLQECNHANKQRIYTYGEVCDVLFYNSEGMNNTNEAIVKRFYKEACVYSIPFYMFKGQIMQATDECSKYSLRYENIKNHFAYWFIGDKEIEEMLRKGMSKEEIVLKVSAVDYWNEKQIQKRWLIEKRKVEMLDRLSSLKISGFLEDNYRRIVIFKDGIHFCKDLCIELANQLAVLLNLDIIDEEKSKEILEDNCMEDKNILPVYPAVIKVLGMEKRYEKFKYQITHADGRVEELDFVNYVGCYIDYVKKVDDIREKCGIRII